MHQTKTGKRERLKKRFLKKLIQRVTIGFMGIVLFVCIYQFFKPKEETTVIENDITEEAKERFLTKDPEDTIDVFTADQTDILLVNKDNPLSDTYYPALKKMINYGVEVSTEIYDALNDMLEAGEREGLRFWIASGYRSPERQRKLLDEDIEALMRQGWSVSEAYEEVIRETMPVGCSEHATGLSVDIVAKDYQMLNDKQGQTEEIKWLQENCSQYGFILRYPEGTEDITGVSYESWHFRYVGVDAAQEITDAGITLEEYLESELLN